ncbi:lipase [Thermaurantimonas aggregans]|uniref:Lipase n=2 Tax=Thermaurantimonas aggregans TaxID=2173829 RepID=A0A401XNE2_9FLAO|nr:lipase [Thermaurantimonas aggregans]
MACRKDKNSANNNNLNPCNQYTPIVFIHGFLASGDTWAGQVMRFTSNGYCADRLYAFDWNTLSQGADNASLLDRFIDSVLQITKASKVNLVGHSAGGGLGYTYLSNNQRAAKVAQYVHIGSNVQSGPAGNGSVPTLNIWSPQDLIVQGGNINGATNVRLDGKDHYEVATCKEAFEAMYEFFTSGKKPKNLDILPENTLSISGKVLTLGENQPRAGADVKIYEIDATTGFRKTTTPLHTLTSDARGQWGPVELNKQTYYEFEVNTRISGDRVVYYYREPFKRSNPLVYLRTLPPANSFVGLLFSGLPNSADQSLLTIFAASQGVSAGRDSLLVNNLHVSTSSLAPPGKNAIAFFLYDGNNNGQSELTPVGLFSQFPFLVGADVYFPTSPRGTISCKLNGRTLNVENKPSASGITIAVFD